MNEILIAIWRFSKPAAEGKALVLDAAYKVVFRTHLFQLCLDLVILSDLIGGGFLFAHKLAPFISGRRKMRRWDLRQLLHRWQGLP